MTHHDVSANLLSDTIVKRLEPYFEQGIEFHGYLSPGFVLGVIMVDLAKEILGPRDLIDAVVETKACVPDAIQLMTSCSYGNGWMRVKDWGKFALTLYDKHKLDGVRVFVNLEEVKKHPSIERWLMREGHTRKEELANEVMKIGRSILSWQIVRVASYRKIENAQLSVCSACGEIHSSTDGDICTRCGGGENYYEVVDSAVE
ncbi:FmdE family protein [Chloroflexota bacterium]